MTVGTPGRPVAEPARCLVLLAKAPVPGRVKTRLQPTFTAHEAAELAEAALRDTVEALAARDAHLVVALEGPTGPWLPERAEVVPQPTGGLDVRLAAAFRSSFSSRGGPALLVGMDTPQLAPYLDVDFADHDAVLGLAVDGGYWAVGLRDARDDAFLGVPMSAADTGRRQLERLESLGLRVRLLPVLRDVDEPADAEVVAAEHPGTNFAAAYRRLRGAS